ncbi:hypothetical protein PUN28_016980 [Cardiocondyla obscurior]|uniref:MADF domain-containing protein n=1 Tax=Cardiocondyla obscurior TaxID=286306 RepID=A0AAW2EQN5_9HYME
MNKDEIRHKCGYCGWIFRFSTNFLEHDCFKHYIEGEDKIFVDENYVVTLYGAKATESPANDSLDELLIGAVKTRKALYDFRLPAATRTNLRKNSLWKEVSNLLGGALNPEEAKARWKYLRDNYLKARKKMKSYIPSGSDSAAVNVKKTKFRFYDMMAFLSDVLETRQTVSSLSDLTNVNYETPHEENADLFQSRITIQESFQELMLSPTIQEISTSSSSSQNINETSKIPVKNTKRFRRAEPNDDEPEWPSRESKTIIVLYTFYTNNYVSKNKSEGQLEAALLKALEVLPPAQTIDPPNTFLLHLGEMMQKLPLLERMRVEIDIFKLVADKLESCSNY